MVIGSHVIFSTYGFWLPNDPRGSWSEFVGAWELFRAGGRMDDARSVEPSALRYLTLAGDRGMGLNVARAQAHFRRALELAPEGHPQRPRILGRLGEAAQISGDLVEAAQAQQAPAA